VERDLLWGGAGTIASSSGKGLSLGVSPDGVQDFSTGYKLAFDHLPMRDLQPVQNAAFETNSGVYVATEVLVANTTKAALLTAAKVQFLWPSVALPLP